MIQDWSLKLAKQKPVLGFGYDSFDRVKNSANFTAGALPVSLGLDSTSHNTFLTVLVQYGGVGLLLLLATAARDRAARGESRPRTIRRALAPRRRHRSRGGDRLQRSHARPPLLLVRPGSPVDLPRAHAPGSRPGERESIRLVVVSEFPTGASGPRGGVEASTVRLVRALARAGVEVSVVAPFVGRPSDPVHAYHGIRVQHIRHPGRLALATSMRSWRRAASRTIEALGPGVVHGQGVLTGGLPACDVSGIPRVVTAHGNARADTLADYKGLAGSSRARLRDRLSRRVVSEADAIVNVHPDWRVNLPVRPERSIYIPNIVDEVFFAVERAPRPGVVLYCGGPAPIKGWDVLLTAWPSIRRAVPGVSLSAAGFPDPASVPSVDGLVPLGMLRAEQLAAEMARASVLVIPSRYEVAPLVLSEAWAARVPVVTTTAGGLEMLAAGAAVQVAPEQPVALAEAVCRILTDDAGAEPIVREGTERAARLTAASVASAHIALYEELVRRG